MKNHGNWVSYKPAELPPYAPFNAIFWKRDDDDWYVWSRSNWNILEGVDASGTTKVVVSDDRVVAAEKDATYLSLPTEFKLYELEENETAPKPGWIFSDGSFIEPTTGSATAN
ncbi:hypothetical protein G6L16_021465 [Agrobacterium tumefaciens]|uniref:hypothetical protein n=1 Tax=Agrobacterium tumefaciens TaxID=358 RepID=UPI0015738AA8|nr:hypothetical protein [Agrobacterium tumefaciens]NSZ64608.1 hypothetical protein [Agrobacterium tumefaciens]NTA70978.1 hypothetical protein [Agrobacterium tumefaciens]WIE40769.1 hypothetical protein G6L16_021465 [Agrobacterium tumefaciens]